MHVSCSIFIFGHRPRAASPPNSKTLDIHTYIGTWILNTPAQWRRHRGIYTFEPLTHIQQVLCFTRLFDYNKCSFRRIKKIKYTIYSDISIAYNEQMEFKLKSRKFIHEIIFGIKWCPTHSYNRRLNLSNETITIAGKPNTSNFSIYLNIKQLKLSLWKSKTRSLYFLQPKQQPLKSTISCKTCAVTFFFCHRV